MQKQLESFLKLKASYINNWIDFEVIDSPQERGSIYYTTRDQWEVHICASNKTIAKLESILGEFQFTNVFPAGTPWKAYIFKPTVNQIKALQKLAKDLNYQAECKDFRERITEELNDPALNGNRLTNQDKLRIIHEILK